MSNTDWDLYEAGKKYNNQIKCVNGTNYYDLMAALVDFVNDNQWRNIELTEMRKPVFNILNKALRFWVSSITANNTKLDLEPLEYAQTSADGQMSVADFASAEIENLFEKFKIDNRIREALFKAGTMGDVAAHFYFDPKSKPFNGAFQNVQGEICMELVRGANVYFGNANNPSTDVKVQPWIGLSGRDLVKNLKAEAKLYKDKQEDQDNIQEDRTEEFDRGIEIETDGYGKATYFLVYKYDPDKQTIFASKCVENGYIYKDVDTELSVYPIAWLPWDRQENQYHGRPPLAGAMETQIYINVMFALIMYHQLHTAFSKYIYDKRRVPEPTNRVGEAIPVDGINPGDSVDKLISTIKPGEMSEQVVQVLRLAYDYLKDMLGINDAALGEVNPEQASGQAIIATVKQSNIPLENTKSNMFEWIEDIGRILLDMMGTYYGNRPIMVEEDGVKSVQWFDFSQLKNIWLNVRVDVGTTNMWSDTARKQTLMSLFNANKIELIDLLERLDDNDIPDRQGLIDKIQGTMNDKQLLYAQMEKFVISQPPEVQAQLEQLRQTNPQEYEATVRQMMGGGNNGGQQPMPQLPSSQPISA